MKKTFSLLSTDKPVERHIQFVKSELKKYIARERRKKLPEEFDFWEFDCKFGNSIEDATPVFANELKTLVDKFVSDDKKSFYVEILSRPAKMKSKSKVKPK